MLWLQEDQSQDLETGHGVETVDVLTLGGRLFAQDVSSLEADTAAVRQGRADGDRDGMPDVWEELHGFDPANPADAALDSDGDGFTNLAECAAGTDPRDPGSTPYTPPTLAAVGPRVLVAGRPTAFTVTATGGVGGGPVFYDVSGLPPGATFVDGEFRWTPEVSSSGNYVVTFAISDGTNTDEETVTLRVAAPEGPGWGRVAGGLAAEGSTLDISRPQAGPFNEQSARAVAATPLARTGDVDGDGKLDLVSVAGTELRIDYAAAGKPDAMVLLPITGESPVIEDVTGDGAAEILVGSSGTLANQVRVYKGDATPLYTVVGRAGAGDPAGFRMLPVAYSGAGKLLVAYDSGPETDPRGYAAFDLATGTELWHYDIGPGVTSVAAADTDADGALELVASVWTPADGAAGNGTTDSTLAAIVVGADGIEKLTRSLPSEATALSGASRLIPVDLDADGLVELVAAVSDGGTPAGPDVLQVLKASDASVLHSRDLTVGAAPRVVVCDLDSDGAKELAVSTAEGVVSVYDKDLNLLITQAGVGTLLSAGDLDGDGVPELLVADGDILRVLDAAALTEDWSIAVGGEGAPAVEAAFPSDVDGDGYAEVVVTQAGKVTILGRPVVSTVAAPANGGAVTGGGSYASGDIARLTAVPAGGYRFAGWSDGATGTANPLDVVVSGDVTVTANFVRRYTLAVSPNLPAGGTVTGAGTYDAGKVVKLTATPAPGYRFVNWTGAYVGTTNPVNVTANADKSYTANFVALGSYFLTTLSSPAAGGTVTGSGGYLAGKVATITAGPVAGYHFAGWKEYPGAGNPLKVTANADKTITAKFLPPCTVTASASPAAGGAVIGTGTYLPLATATLTATPSVGYRFKGWSGSVTSTANPLLLKVDGNKALTANFVRQYTITATANPAGDGTISGAGTYDSGKVVTLMANANPGYRFVRWSGAYSGTTNPVKITASSDKALTAYFEPVP